MRKTIPTLSPHSKPTMSESSGNEHPAQTPSSEALSIASLARRCQDKQRFVASLAAFFVYLLGRNGRGLDTVPRGLFSFSSMLAGTPSTFFKRLYGIPHRVFMALAEKVTLEDQKKFRRSCPLLRLSVTIRWLAGGSYLDIALAHGI